LVATGVAVRKGVGGGGNVVGVPVGAASRRYSNVLWKSRPVDKSDGTPTILATMIRPIGIQINRRGAKRRQV
jgi:hypothetical protein